jgi:hypothetical protein
VATYRSPRDELRPRSAGRAANVGHNGPWVEVLPWPLPRSEIRASLPPGWAGIVAENADQVVRRVDPGVAPSAELAPMIDGRDPARRSDILGSVRLTLKPLDLDDQMGARPPVKDTSPQALRWRS